AIILIPRFVIRQAAEPERHIGFVPAAIGDVDLRYDPAIADDVDLRTVPIPQDIFADRLPGFGCAIGADLDRFRRCSDRTRNRGRQHQSHEKSHSAPPDLGTEVRCSRSSGQAQSLDSAVRRRQCSAMARVLLIVGGGIAAYKSLELVRLLKKAGHQVTPVLTKGGEHFVTAMSLGTLAESQVHSSLWELNDEVEIGHI